MSDVTKKETEIVETITVQPLTLKLNDCQKIIALPGLRPYKNTKEGSRHHLKSYLTFTYMDGAFTLIEGHPFTDALKGKDLYTVELLPTLTDGKKGYTLLSFTTRSDTLSNHKFDVDMNAYTVEHVQNKREINPEDLA